MKIYKISALTLVTILGIGVAVFYAKRNPAAENEYASAERAEILPPTKTTPPAPEKTVPLTPPSVVEQQTPEPTLNPINRVPAAVPPEPVTPKSILSREERKQNALNRYWDEMARNFNRQLDQLDREQNPKRRLSLIQTLARYVQIDTLTALDWAATLTDPQEQRAALNAINQHALTGIGARIDSDETGLPVIRKTTILSAVESTGQVEAGDYIAGMIKPDGTQVYFKDWPLQKVAQALRGEPGSEVQLMMERVSSEGVWVSFDVPVQRSLIVMQPQF